MNKQQFQGRVLVVAGSDPSGGAGIQADIKTITAFEAYAATAITALTVQNSRGVQAVYPVDAGVVAAQIKAVLDDIGAETVKTGMLVSAETVHAVAMALIECGFEGDLIVDPVMVSTSGAALLDPDGIKALTQTLIPRATLVTPNIPEAEILSGTTIASVDDMVTAGLAICRMGAQMVLVKGGHLNGNRLTDILVGQGFDHEIRIERDKIDSRHTHGTGCTLASAWAAALSFGSDGYNALQAASDFIDQAILRAPGFGAGKGPLGHMAARKAMEEQGMWTDFTNAGGQA